MKKASNGDLTLVIPTINRHDRLVRVLDFYARKDFCHSILVADSSMAEVARANEDAVRNAGRKLNVEYRQFDSCIAFGRKIEQAITGVSTEFACFCADDDFICPETMCQCVEFLRKNPDYIAAQGTSLVYSVERQPSRRRFVFYPHVVLVPPPLNQERAADRLMAHLRNYYETFYAVHRRDELEANLILMNAYTDDYWFAELFTSYLSVMKGKVRRLDGLYAIMERHGDNAGATTKCWGQLMLDGEFSRRYREFRGSLAAEFAATTGESMGVGENILDSTFEGFMKVKLRHASGSQGSNGMGIWQRFRRSLVARLLSCGAFGTALQAAYARIRVAPWLYTSGREYRAQLSFIEEIVLQHHAA